MEYIVNQLTLFSCICKVILEKTELTLNSNNFDITWTQSEEVREDISWVGLHDTFCCTSSVAWCIATPKFFGSMFNPCWWCAILYRVLISSPLNIHTRLYVVVIWCSLTDFWLFSTILLFLLHSGWLFLDLYLHRLLTDALRRVELITMAFGIAT